MKYLILLLLPLAACTHITHPTAGEYTSVGGDTAKFRADAAGFSFDSNNNSLSFKAVLSTIDKMWRNFLVAEGLKWVAGRYYDHQGAIVAGDKAIKLEELRNAKSVADAEAALATLKETNRAGASTALP